MDARESSTDAREGFMDAPGSATDTCVGFMDAPGSSTDAREGFVDAPESSPDAGESLARALEGLIVASGTATIVRECQLKRAGHLESGPGGSLLRVECPCGALHERSRMNGSAWGAGGRRDACA
jgi:hypothetical protein